MATARERLERLERAIVELAEQSGLTSRSVILRRFAADIAEEQEPEEAK